jgi:glucosamine kinase
LRPDALFLGIDGGATNCRARLCAASGDVLGEAIAGPANIRFGLERALKEVSRATADCLDQAGLPPPCLSGVTACLALAGATEPKELAAARRHKYQFGHTIITNDARAACIGAHCGHDGGVIVIGTGTIGWAELRGRQYRIGGWGLPISDDGGAAWLGCEGLRRVLWAHDGRIAETGLLSTLFHQFNRDPHAIVRWTFSASPRDFGAMAPIIVDYANRDDRVGVELMQLAAHHIDALTERLLRLGAPRLSLVGGLAAAMAPWVSRSIQKHLVAPAGDALDGALRMARATEKSAAA